MDTTSPSPRGRRLATLPEPLTVRRLWRSRDRTTALYVRLLTRDEYNLADIRLWGLDNAGRMQPGEGFWMDIHRVPELAAALVALHRRAIELNLIDRRQ